jgi:Fumarase C C-terminus
LSPVIGYDQASVIARHTIGHNLTLRQAALANGVSEDRYDRVVNRSPSPAAAPPTFRQANPDTGAAKPIRARLAATAGEPRNTRRCRRTIRPR